MDAIPGLMRDMWAAPMPSLPEALHQHGVVATGVGSSEAAARYFVFLLQQAGLKAAFWPQSVFYGALPAFTGPPPCLAVFSQGLSPNAEMVLARRNSFADTLLFTASTADGQRQAGRENRARLLERLSNEGATLYVHPMENEYEILPRFVGPLCSMFAVALVVTGLAPEVFPSPRQIPETLDSVSLPDENPEAWTRELQAGPNFFFTNPTSQYAQNLSCKVLETLFQRPPQLLDALTYAHGPFQLDCLRPGANWMFLTDDPHEQKLTQTLAPLFERGGAFRQISSPLPVPFAIFYYEAFLNKLLLHSLETLDVDLVDWPGKGLDGEGYGIREPDFRSV
ncbi:MAG: hypothetical protein JJU29_04830 [Verrucomicrobia bacterium]|nr:hypothetical protein [Verrucomicrobiota bacterium]MCH8510267.1 hypothetical protein [Kiritimatiellia bacterium]